MAVHVHPDPAAVAHQQPQRFSNARSTASAHHRTQARFELPVLSLQRVDERLVLRDVLLHRACVAAHVRLDLLSLQAGRDGRRAMFRTPVVCAWGVMSQTSGGLGGGRACALKMGKQLTAGNNTAALRQ